MCQRMPYKICQAHCLTGMEKQYNIDMRMRNIRNTSRKIEGHPITTQRRLLLELIRHADGHIDAKELYRLASSQGKPISLATVYRSLRLFKELDLVEQRQLGQLRCYYEIKQPIEHQHLVCRRCGRVIEFESPLIRQLAKDVQHQYSFNVTGTELYLEGYCPQCKETS